MPHHIREEHLFIFAVVADTHVTEEEASAIGGYDVDTVKLGAGIRRQLNRNINRIEKKLSAVARRSEVMFLMPSEDVDEAKWQRYGDKIADESGILIVTFRSAQGD